MRYKFLLLLFHLLAFACTSPSETKKDEGCKGVPDNSWAESDNDTSRLKAIRTLLSKEGCLDLPVMAVCVGDGYEKFEASLLDSTQIMLDGINMGNGIVGVLPDTSINFGVIACQALDNVFPVLYVVNKQGAVINQSNLFSDDGWDHDISLDSTLFLTEYTIVKEDLLFSKVLESKSIEHVWENGSNPMLNDNQEAMKDTANFLHFKIVVTGRINKDYTVTVDWNDRDTLINKKVGLKYDWENSPEIDMESLSDN